jgi:triphosphatase
MIEREIKFRLPEGRDPAAVRDAVESAGFRLEPAGTISHEDRYLDTEDWVLCRAGIALRLRHEQERVRLEAKTIRSVEDGAGLSRMEWAQDAPDKELPWTTIPTGPVAALLRPLEGLRVLQRLRVQSRVVNDRECFRWLRGPNVLGSLTVDNVSVPPMAFREIELELRNGGGDALGEVRRTIAERLGLEPAAETKLAAALAAVGVAVPEQDERAFTLVHSDRLLDLGHKLMGRQLARLLWNEPGTRLGVDPESLHDMRVACRRIRTALEVIEEAYPESMRAEFSPEFRWLGRGLGRVRDLDVMLHKVRSMLPEATVIEQPALSIFAQSLEIQRVRRRLKLIRRLDAPSYVELIAKGADWVHAGPPPAAQVPGGSTAAYAFAPKIIGHWVDSMRKAFERAEHTMAEEDLHVLRIAAKKSRYAMEYFADLEGANAVRRARRIAGLQDLLGDHRDANALLRRMRKYARGVPKKDRELVMGVGSVLGHLERAARIRRSDLRDAWEKAIAE